jgi:glyoxylate utilization-related uncharacterized protein
MKLLAKFFALAAALVPIFSTSLFAQPVLGKGPASKLYLAETKGGGKIENNGQVYEPKQGTAFDAAGTVMMTGKDSHQAYVLSTGSGLYLDASTEVQVNQFDQERFQPGQAASDVEPSVSHVQIAISHGLIACCASQMVSGTTMVFSTPLASVNVRGRQVAVQVNPDETTVYVLEGSVTVSAGDQDAGGLTLQPGEQAVIRPGPPGQPPVTTVGPIDHDERSRLDGQLAIACNARKTVTFETIEAKTKSGAGDSTEEIVAKPTVTVLPPDNLTVSPDRITPGT